MRLLHRNIKVATEMIEERHSDGERLGDNAATIIKASSMSYGGMTRRRQQVRQPHEQFPREQHPEELRRRIRQERQHTSRDEHPEEVLVPQVQRGHRNQQPDKYYARRIPQPRHSQQNIEYRRARGNHRERPRPRRQPQRIETRPPKPFGCCFQ